MHPTPQSLSSRAAVFTVRAQATNETSEENTLQKLVGGFPLNTIESRGMFGNSVWPLSTYNTPAT